MKGFWKVLGLAALVGSIPFKAEKDENGEIKRVKALLWQYSKETNEDEVNHQLCLGPNLDDLKQVGGKVTAAVKNVKENFLPAVDVNVDLCDSDCAEEAEAPACDAVTEDDFADAETPEA